MVADGGGVEMAVAATALETQLIEAEGLWRVYRLDSQEVPALRGVSLQVGAGRFVAVQGRSGSGKTTLLNCLGGLDRPTSGMVRVFGLPLGQLSDDQLTRWRREHVGLIFQSFSLLPTLSAYENVELMLRIAGVRGRDRRERTLASLELVGLGNWSHHRPFELSGGQQQRLVIARALAARPRLILADEPTGELDSLTAREIMALFRRIVDENRVTLVMASHDSLAGEYVDEVLHLQDGQLVTSN
jgi:ABC-type lipoprotein export system ATPase subunit